MCNGSAESTTRCGSLFGNGSSQSSLVFTPPLVAMHSNCDLIAGLCCDAAAGLAACPGTTLRFAASSADGSGELAPTLPASAPANTAVTAASRTSRSGLIAPPPLGPGLPKGIPYGRAACQSKAASPSTATTAPGAAAGGAAAPGAVVRARDEVP